MLVIEIQRRIGGDRWVQTVNKETREVESTLIPTFKATLKGATGVWGTGDGPKEAIGDMVLAHPEMFNLTITDAG